ncbi:YlmC/YmxH family sporulation protein [Desulforamulus putei]|uniref:Sporulation protein, YlmC/YmxH family n=1 Tax=Desulforamulus putei DSM 12395 TaxID=1121429 RepID=A0A1M5BJF0_9FIRM|nr:YlmC/YmxH family sporulation protein [Desulforamulus putei]SHF42704.1 sporulation protein, YlmC/YmxH family [Desulforamulus putei DSM 12395]
MIKISDLRVREVVNIVDGRRLGLIKDIDIDLEAGRIAAIILPGQGRFLGLFGREDELIVPWDKIKKIGIDTILVEIAPYQNPGEDSFRY